MCLLAQPVRPLALHGGQRRGDVRQHHAGRLRLRRRGLRRHLAGRARLHQRPARQAEGVSGGDGEGQGEGVQVFPGNNAARGLLQIAGWLFPRIIDCTCRLACRFGEAPLSVDGAGPPRQAAVVVVLALLGESPLMREYFIYVSSSFQEAANRPPVSRPSLAGPAARQHELYRAQHGQTQEVHYS